MLLILRVMFTDACITCDSAAGIRCFTSDIVIFTCHLSRYCYFCRWGYVVWLGGSIVC